MKDREYSMDKGKSKHQEEDEDSGKKSPFYSRDICGGGMMENQGLGNEKQGIKPALQDLKRSKDLDLGYEILVETTVSDPPPHENSREYSIDKGKGKQQKDSAEDNLFAWDFRGVASTMMEKMEYSIGEGLGKYKQGIKHPIQATKLPQKLKLGIGYRNYDSLVNTTVSDPPPNENSWDYIQRLKDDEENMVSIFKEAAAEVTLPPPATKFTLSRVPSENRRNPLPLQVITKLKGKTISTEDERSARDELGNEEPDSPVQGGMPGSRSISSFQKLKRIHEGPFGVVYKARDEITKEIVALKQIKVKKDKYQEEYGFSLTALREINILLSCDNPSILNMKEIVVGGKEEADVYMVMEYLEHDLEGIMKRKKGAFFCSEVKCLMIQLLEGVKYLHNNWIIHRDLNPSNLLMDNTGNLKIGDFGMACHYCSPIKPYTQTVISQCYRPPELLLGANIYSTEVDMWSTGCIMAEMLTLKPLFPGTTVIDQLKKIFAVLGTPNEASWPGFSRLPYAQVEFPTQPYNKLRMKFPTQIITEKG